MRNLVSFQERRSSLNNYEILIELREKGRILKLIIRLILLLYLILAFSDPISAESEADRVKMKVDAATKIKQQTQKNEDKWASQKAELKAEYQSLKPRLEQLKKHKEKTEKILTLQRGRVEELKRNLRESVKVRDELYSNLDSWAVRLETWISQDLPFLPDERTKRLASIKEMMADPNIKSAEKFRRAMEALQVETEYGATVEVYQDTVELNGRSTLVNIFRLGRLTLFYQTPDRKDVGYYNRATGKWEALPGKYRHDIDMAVEMAGKQRPIDLIKLPIGRIVP
jgi:DNA repair exonuclease SbcCD ATPase subunit